MNDNSNTSILSTASFNVTTNGYETAVDESGRSMYFSMSETLTDVTMAAEQIDCNDSLNKTLDSEMAQKTSSLSPIPRSAMPMRVLMDMNNVQQSSTPTPKADKEVVLDKMLPKMLNIEQAIRNPLVPTGQQDVAGYFSDINRILKDTKSKLNDLHLSESSLTLDKENAKGMKKKTELTSTLLPKYKNDQRKTIAFGSAMSTASTKPVAKPRTVVIPKARLRPSLIPTSSKDEEFKINRQSILPGVGNGNKFPETVGVDKESQKNTITSKSKLEKKQSTENVIKQTLITNKPASQLKPIQESVAKSLATRRTIMQQMKPTVIKTTEHIEERPSLKFNLDPTKRVGITFPKTRCAAAPTAASTRRSVMPSTTTAASFKDARRSVMPPTVPTSRIIPKERRSMMPSSSGIEPSKRRSLKRPLVISSPLHKPMKSQRRSIKATGPLTHQSASPAFKSRIRQSIIKKPSSKLISSQFSATATTTKPETASKNAIDNAAATIAASLAYLHEPTPVKDFKCGHCQKTFHMESTYQTHLKSHKVLKKAASSDRKCSYCDKVFALKNALDIHLEEKCTKIPVGDRRRLLIALQEKGETKAAGGGHTRSLSARSVASSHGSSSCNSSMASQNSILMAPPSAMNTTLRQPAGYYSAKIPHSGIYRTPTKPLPCRTCNIVFTDIASFVAHRDTHVEEIAATLPPQVDMSNVEMERVGIEDDVADMQPLE